MLFLVVSECHDKALQKSKRILSSYMQQLGSRTWADTLTQEGVDELFAELRASASKATAVQCFRVKRNGYERVWRVGNKDSFTEEGLHAFASTKKDYLSGEAIETPMARIAHYSSIAASLLHDIGKINRQFQDKIVASTMEHCADYARHELISCSIFFRVVDRLRREDPAEVAILAAMADPEHLASLFDDVLKEGLFKKLSPQAPFVEMSILLKGEDYPVLSAIMFMIASHHKLPSGKEDPSGKVKTTLEKHVNDRVTDETRRAMNATFDADKNNFMADGSSPFITSLSDQFKRLAGARGEEGDVDFNTLMKVISYYNRVALIMSDRYVSSSDTFTKSFSDREFYANSRLDRKGKRHYAQTLQDHLVEVGRGTNRNFRRLLKLVDREDDNALPVVSRVPPTLETSGEDSSSRFYWQDDLIRRIKTKRREGIAESGFFGILVAGTGSGKTRANAKIMAAICPEMRYTLAVGLRTLTLQTQTEYISDVGLSKAETGMLIGSDISKRLYDMNQQAHNTDASSLGIDAEQDDEIDGHFVDDFTASDALGDDFMRLLKPKEKSMLLYPVVVCTVDHLIQVANMTRGKHMASSLRTMTADLILDEVDSYSDVDMVSIGKLIYRAGMSGRRVVVSSATVNSDTIETLYNAYEEGYRAYCRLKGKEPKIYTGWFSEYADINRVKKVDASEDFARLNTQFLGRLADKLGETPVRRSASIMPMDGQETRRDVFEMTRSAIQALHKEHCQVCPKTGVRLSCGMVRWNVVDSAIRFTEHLLEAKHDGILKVMCYHSRQMAYVLDMQSELLNQLLNRKNPDAIFQHPALAGAMAEAERTGTKDLTFIVSTTSIEEVGRDHDFDFAITEPASYRSLVQMSGRVRRHRPGECASPNVVLMDRPIRSCNNSPRKTPTGGDPDIKAITDKIIFKMADNSRSKEISGEAWGATGATSVKEFMSHGALEKIDARSCLMGKADTNRNDLLSLYEFGKRELALRGSISGEVHQGAYRRSLQYYIENAVAYSNDLHYNANPFRASTRSTIFFKTDQGDWMRVGEKPGDQPIFANENVSEASVEDRHGRLIMANGFDDRLQEVIERLSIDNDETMKNSLRAVSVISGDNANINIHYHPALGAFNKGRTCN